MGRHLRTIRRVLAVVWCVSGPLARAAAPTPKEANTPLTAASKRELYAFASTPDGLFRASLTTRRWERLTLSPGMPRNGKFARQPAPSRLILYVATRSMRDPPPRDGARYGLYLSRDDGLTWDLLSERNDFGAVLLHPSGALFAVTGDDGLNHGSNLLRSPDLGRSWRDITGNAHAQLVNIEPDPEHPNLVRVRGWARRRIMFTADDENYRWRAELNPVSAPGRRPSAEFFSRDWSTTSTYFTYQATLANYFSYAFENLASVPGLEAVPVRSLFRFTRGARVAVPLRVVFHYDREVDLYYWRKSVAEGRHAPMPTPPRIKFADQPDGTDFWGLRVESPHEQLAKYPPDGPIVTGNHRATRIKYQLINLSPSAPYERELDLGRFFDFSKPGEYRVQIIYDSSGHPDTDKDEWDGNFTSPVFTVVIQE